MKRVLIAGALAVVAGGQVFAGDLPAAPPPTAQPPAIDEPVAPPVYNWSGIYLGMNGGYAFGSSDWTLPSGADTGNFDASGWLVGGTVGFNYQINVLVLGAETDLDWSNVVGNSGSTVPLCVGAATAGAPSCQTASSFISTARGRLGFATDRVLYYGTVGLAYANIQAGLNPPATYDSSKKIGWTAGVGVEWAFAQNWTVKVEYLFADFADLENGSCTTTANCGSTAGSAVKFTESLVRAGVNFNFGPW